MRFATAMNGRWGLHGMRARSLPWLTLMLACAAPAHAQTRDVLGIFGTWGAFRDAAQARCFAIAEPTDAREPGRGWSPFAAIGYWPRQSVRGQISIRLSRELAPGAAASLSIGGKRFTLSGGGADVWEKDRRDDAAIVAALRAGGRMSVHGRAAGGVRFSDHYELRGAATAIDAAALGCARIR